MIVTQRGHKSLDFILLKRVFALHSAVLCILCRCVQVCGRGGENIRRPRPEEEEHGRHHAMGSHWQQHRPYRQRCKRCGVKFLLV